MKGRLKAIYDVVWAPSKEAVFICILREWTRENAADRLTKSSVPFNRLPGRKSDVGKQNNGMQTDSPSWVNGGLTAAIAKKCPQGKY